MGGTRIVFALFLVLLLHIGPSTSAVSGQDKHEAFWELVETVKDILAGRNLEHAKASIAAGAHLVCGAHFENLERVVSGEASTCSLADTSYRSVMINAKTNESEDAGFLVLKTVTSDNLNVRFHTVVFMKDSTGQYKINGWHTGEGSQ